MIEFVRTYTENKFLFEEFITNGKNVFDDIKSGYNLKRGIKAYPIEAEKNGLSVRIDDYLGSLSVQFRVFYYSLSNTEKLYKKHNITFSMLESCINELLKIIDGINDFKVSQIHIGFRVSIGILSKQIIKSNIFTHKMKYYNHNTKSGIQDEFKSYDYTNYIVEIRSIDDDYLLLVVKLKKSREFQNSGLERLLDFHIKEIYERLFGIFLLKIDELEIVDSFDYNNIKDVKDRELLKQYMDYGYWERISNSNSRQTKSMHRKKFKSLIEKYNLNTIKAGLLKSIEQEFERFINN